MGFPDHLPLVIIARHRVITFDVLVKFTGIYNEISKNAAQYILCHGLQFHAVWLARSSIRRVFCPGSLFLGGGRFPTPNKARFALNQTG